MKLAIICLIGASISSALFGDEIESKILPSEKKSLSGIVGGPIEDQTIKSTTTEYYRNSIKVLEKRDLEETLKLKGKDASTTNRQVWVIFANEREVLVIAHPDKRPYEVASPWPIYIEHNQAQREDYELVWFNVCIPEIDFYEYIEFRDGEFSPLLEGEEYAGMRETHMQFAETELAKGS